jgi:DNA-binding response OmpR family regulator
MKILLIEPDRSTAEAVTDYLSAQKHTVTWVRTAAAAIAAADKKHPDCVVLELALGTHGGIEFLHEFKSYADLQAIPVLAFTLQYFEDTSQLKKLGVAAYLYKPKTSLLQLSAAIKQLAT